MKKNYQIFSMMLISFVTFIGSQSLMAQIQIPAKIQKSLQPNQIPKGITVPANLLKKDIDLSAAEIKFSIVSVKDRFNGTVKIEGVVKNVGRGNYTSGDNQQTVLLYEEVPGLSPKLVASRNFQNVPVNGTVSVSFTRNWRTADEFPPSYIVMIVFDPDIYIDGNDNNNDANSANNRISKSGSAINALNWKR
ncbi:MAG: hypothetical protein ABL872_04310 [Lacibacter sp.]